MEYATVILKWGPYKIPREALNHTACCIVIAANGRQKVRSPKAAEMMVRFRDKMIVDFKDNKGGLINSIALYVRNPPLTLGAEALEVHGWKDDGKQIKPVSFKKIKSPSPACSNTKLDFAKWLKEYHCPKMPVYISKPGYRI